MNLLFLGRLLKNLGKNGGRAKGVKEEKNNLNRYEFERHF